jgi:hypothetical protein
MVKKLVRAIKHFMLLLTWCIFYKMCGRIIYACVVFFKFSRGQTPLLICSSLFYNSTCCLIPGDLCMHKQFGESVCLHSFSVRIDLHV